MNWWSELGLQRDSKEVVVPDSKRTLVGLKSSTKVLLENSYQKLSDPIYDSNIPEVAFGVVEDNYGRCGLFCIKVPFDETENITVYWLPENVKSVRKLNGKIFWLYDIVMKPVWVVCLKNGMWEIHPIT